MEEPHHRRSRRAAAGALPLLAAAVFALAAPGVASGSDGTWERAWGHDVVEGGGTGTGYEICTVASFCKDGLPSSGLGGELGAATDLATDALGNVYVVDAEQHRIEKFDSSGNWLRAWGKDVVVGGGIGFEICTVAASCRSGRTGGLGGEMDEPGGVATDTAGNVYVADSANHRIQKFDPSGNFLMAWGRDVELGGPEEADVCTVAKSCQEGLLGGRAGELDYPVGIAVEPSTGNVYVAEARNERIQKFTEDAAFLRAWGMDVVSNGPASVGAEICRQDDVCKQGDPFGGGRAGEFTNPVDVAIDAAGNIHVVDRLSNRIQKFNTVGDFLLAWGNDVVSGGGGGFEVCTPADTCKRGAVGELGGEFHTPQGIAADAAGRIYVTEFENHRIQVFDLSGGFQATWGRDVVPGAPEVYEICTFAAGCQEGQAGDLGGELNHPLGIDADAAEDVYVADTTNIRIQKFTTRLPPPPLPPPPEIDTGMPQTTIFEAPPPKTKKKAVSFEFSSSEQDSSFECKLDDAGFESCSSPFSTKVNKGKHTFSVRASDAAGNTDSTPATYSWKVKKRRRK